MFFFNKGYLWFTLSLCTKQGTRYFLNYILIRELSRILSSECDLLKLHSAWQLTSTQGLPHASRLPAYVTVSTHLPPLEVMIHPTSSVVWARKFLTSYVLGKILLSHRLALARYLCQNKTQLEPSCSLLLTMAHAFLSRTNALREQGPAPVLTRQTFLTNHCSLSRQARVWPQSICGCKTFQSAATDEAMRLLGHIVFPLSLEHRLLG